MQLFYSNLITEATNEFTFSREESKHITKVLRKKEGDTLHITNGLGLLCKGFITFSNLNKCIIELDSKEFHPAKEHKLHMAVAPTKMNDRYEWFLEKATEIGIDEITPILCDHSERKSIKSERFERILQSAMKQSLQYHLPKLNPMVSFSEFIAQNRKGQLLIAHCEESNKKSIQEILKPKNNITFLIGPEGDFSPTEIEKALKKGYLPVSLGNNRLRTETAAIVSCSIHSLINQ